MIYLMGRYDFQCLNCKKLTTIHPPEGCDFPVHEMFCGWCQEGEGKMRLLMYAEDSYDCFYEIIMKLKDLEAKIEKIEREMQLDLEANGEFEV